MKLDLTDEQAITLLKALDGIIEADRFFLSPRIFVTSSLRAHYAVAEIKASSFTLEFNEPHIGDKTIIGHAAALRENHFDRTCGAVNCM